MVPTDQWKCLEDTPKLRLKIIDKNAVGGNGVLHPHAFSSELVEVILGKRKE